ncbi:hypothetical protein Tco_0952627 [Tanacetum coccineum]|uniref:Uncharacterized protein n=1 Tax=Tanacetum coccineum TaxID=301880 RepID=A0ABQ5DYA9_9ASTR
MAPLPPHEQRRPFLRYQGLEYSDADIADFEERMVMEHRDDVGVVVFTSQAWGRLFDTRGPLVWELILEFLNTLRFGEGPPPSYTLIRDPMLRLCHRMMAHSIAGRSQVPEKSGAHISVIAPELPIIDMAKLVRLQIYEQLDNTWVWVAMGLERQPDAAAGALRVAKDSPIVDEGSHADPTPVHAPPPPPPAAARTMPQRMAKLEEDVHEIRGALTEQREAIDCDGLEIFPDSVHGLLLVLYG